MPVAEPGKATLRFSDPYEDEDGLVWVSFLVVSLDPPGSVIRWIDDEDDGRVVLECLAGEYGTLLKSQAERLLVSVQKAFDA